MSCPPELLARHVEHILDVLPDGVFLSDVSGTALYINRVYTQLTGLKREDLVGRNVRDLAREGVFDHILNPEIVRTGKSATRVQQLKDGKRLVLSGFPVRDEAGTLCLVVTFVRDITLLSHLEDEVTSQHRLIDQISDQLAHIAQKNHSQEPVFASPAMTEMVYLLRRLATTDATLLLWGETGVGKDVFARMAHSLSHRKDRVLLKVDCGGISESLTESEFFGYQPGAFTGALPKGKAGYFEIADGSTIFLDEVGELPLAMQTRLLRVLQDGEIMRVGASAPRKVDVRVIAATNQDLAASVEAGSFRRDLYYRLNVATVRIPPLRERPEDIQPLAEYFLCQFNAKYKKSLTFMATTLDAMRAHVWPGNVRELQNLVHSLVITLSGSRIAPRDLPCQMAVTDSTAATCDAALSSGLSLKEVVAAMERDFLLRAIETYGSVQSVAERFQVNRSTIFRKLRGAKLTGPPVR